VGGGLVDGGPWLRTKWGRAEGRERGEYAPRINSSGNLVESATSNPPKPQPISATVICLLKFLTS